MTRPAPLALVAACHPAPAVAVSVMTTVLVIAAGNTWPVCVLGALAITTGQLSIGWSNDLIDADRDAAAGRRDKPAARGAVTRATLRRASAAALLATVVFSLALGWRAGAAQLVMVASGWSYNLGLKAGPWSAVPYFLGFGALPAMATLATGAHRWPPLWTVIAAGLIGVGAHFGNVLPDLAADRQAGVRGLPQRLGAHGSAAAAGLIAVTATALAVFGPPGPAGPVALLILLAVLVVAGATSARAWRDPSSEVAFYAAMLIAAVDIGLICGTHALSGR